VFDDAIKAITEIEDENFYYGVVAMGFISVLLGAALIWICG
jgi:hypothetical protein